MWAGGAGGQSLHIERDSFESLRPMLRCAVPCQVQSLSIAVASDIDPVPIGWLAGVSCRVSLPIVTMDSMIEWGAILAEIGLCYLVGHWRDIGSSCENMRFAVYVETSQKIVALGCPL